MESLDERLGHLKPKPEEIERKGRFLAYYDQLGLIGIGEAFDFIAQGYDDYLMLLREIGLEESVDELVKVCSEGCINLSRDEKLKILMRQVEEAKPYSCIISLLLGELGVKEAIPHILTHLSTSSNLSSWWDIYALKRLGCDEIRLERAVAKYQCNVKSPVFRRQASNELRYGK